MNESNFVTKQILRLKIKIFFNQVVHVKTSHPSRPTVVLVKNIERAFKDSDISSIESLSDSEENESDDKSADKSTTCNDDLDVLDGHAQTITLDPEPVRDPVDDGLVGHSLFRCGNAECQFSAERVFEFRDHISICEFSANAVYLDCYHCKKPFKHVNTLIDHLKNHGLKRFIHILYRIPFSFPSLALSFSLKPSCHAKSH
jgi:hypothetical protein